MKNFTNNFKQFTSRLSARWLIMVLMLLVGTSSAWAKIIYFDADHWHGSDAWFEAWVWGGNSASAWYQAKYLNGNYYKFEIPDDATSMKIIRRGPGMTSGSWDYNNQMWNNTSDLTISKDLFRITQTSCKECAGEWKSTTKSYKLHGEFNNWTDVDFPADINITTLKDYEFKVKEVISYNSTEIDAIYYGNNGTMDRNNCTGWTMSYSDGNCKITADAKGTYTFTFNESNKQVSVTYPPKCTTANFSVSLPSSGVVNKGDANITASTEGTHSPAVAWTSSDETVATIDEDGNIHALKGGKTTITATTKGTDSYCKDTKKDAELTVKETPTIDIKGDSYGCNEGKTLTANVECTTSYTVKWYKGSINTQAISTGSKYTATESGTYFAQVTDTYINTATSEGFVFTKYTPAAAPSISIGKESICSGESTNITIDGYSDANNYTLYNGNNAVQNPTFNNGVFTVSEAGTYYVTSTPKEGDCTLESAKQATGLTLSVTEVTISLNPTSAPICSGITLADIDTYVKITTNGDRVAWFEANSGGNALNEADEIRQATYYAEATLNGCTSERVAFKVTELLNVPAKPVITPSDAAICSGNAVTLTLETKVAGETYKIGETDRFQESNTWSTPPLSSKTDYVVTAYNSCGSTDSEKLTINVTTTPVISGPSATQPNKEITLSSEAGANTKWETTSGSTLTPETGAETVFKATENGNYTITAKNTANNITCSATHSIVVNDKFYIYIRRPKSGTTTYDQWYEKTNDADKGAHPWMKNGSEYKTGDDYTNNNYDGNGPESTFTDCNGYVWDAFIAPGTSFFIHAPNTFQEGGQEGYATFTQVTNITSTATDLYYTINQWAGHPTKGTTLSPASEPNRIPEVAVPVLSIDPVSGIICQGAEATITVTNPENGVSYKLNYEGKDQTNSIAYTGTGKVEFAVTEAGTYLVKAETTNGTCKGNAVSIAREIQVITTSISFEGAPYVTTPWEPITIIVNVPKGYNYTFNDTQLTQIASPDTPIKKVSGSEYTYSFPRPSDWGAGNSQTGDSWGEKSYTISATLNGVTETCGTATATVKLQDEGNDNCRTTNN